MNEPDRFALLQERCGPKDDIRAALRAIQEKHDLKSSVLIFHALIVLADRANLLNEY